MRWMMLAGFAALAASLAAPARARADFIFVSNLQTLNNSGVSGQATLILDPDLKRLTVSIVATGLVPDRLHPQHIHGRFDANGNPIESVVPPPTADTDGDGFVELGEGLPFYGPVILPLIQQPSGTFPTAPGGSINFTETYDLTNTALFAQGFDFDDLTPLTQRVIVLHGGFVPPGVDPNLPNGGYLASLPVAAGEIQAVPEPTTATLLLTGLGAGGLVSSARRRYRPKAAA